jgi:hypothetical protein
MNERSRVLTRSFVGKELRVRGLGVGTWRFIKICDSYGPRVKLDWDWFY